MKITNRCDIEIIDTENEHNWAEDIIKVVNIPDICHFFTLEILHSKVRKFATKQRKSPHQIKISHK